MEPFSFASFLFLIFIDEGAATVLLQLKELLGVQSRLIVRITSQKHDSNADRGQQVVRCSMRVIMVIPSRCEPLQLC